MMRHVFASALAALVAVASAQDPLYDYSASPLTELTDANFAETVANWAATPTCRLTPRAIH